MPCRSKTHQHCTPPGSSEQVSLMNSYRDKGAIPVVRRIEGADGTVVISVEALEMYVSFWVTFVSSRGRIAANLHTFSSPPEALQNPLTLETFLQEQLKQRRLSCLCIGHPFIEPAEALPYFGTISDTGGRYLTCHAFKPAYKFGSQADQPLRKLTSGCNWMCELMLRAPP